MHYQFQELTTIPLSDRERIDQTISVDHVAVALSALHRDGIVCLANAVDLEHIDLLNSILSAEAEEMAQLPTTHFNDTGGRERQTGNMSQGPPLQPDLMFQDIWANGPATTVISSLLGPRPRVNYVNGNTALGGYSGARQGVHADLTFNHGLFPFGLVTNYYLVDTSVENGGTELWLGTHRNTSFADHKECMPNAAEGVELGIREELLQQRREYAPPIHATVKRGSVVIRDLRLWHAGVSNPSPRPRIMLAFVHTPWWYQCPGRVVLPESARGLVESWAAGDMPVVYNAHYVPAPIDHKNVAFIPDFSSRNEGFRSQLPDLPPGFIFGAKQ
ncbi:putative phytanoyl-dioxygenase family protein [Coleophoma crateriformis]|uniref:Putative phytanoyl-dioxygenase family protein n=1 Tax=Coleophoma crateriformis TaxID=565419 RepID=A0A3D8R789_9HELO|nr:putative phytanoyl-dioxygenase family protein [Coleophoma crateriformis]